MKIQKEKEGMLIDTKKEREIIKKRKFCLKICLDQSGKISI